MRKSLLLVASVVVCTAVLAQNPIYRTGLVDDKEAYQRIPLKVTLLKRSYTALPSSVSLRQYCPPAASQGDHGTCTAWSTTFAARTIAEAVKWDWTDPKVIKEEAFAPIFVYTEVKGGSDPTCQRGIAIDKALNVLKEKGAPKLKHFNTQCEDQIPAWVREEAKDYKIDSYFRLFGYDQQTPDHKIKAVKKALAGKSPVVISMHLPESFFEPIGDVWERGPFNISNAPGYHAMCVIGYDDNKAGGAFEIMNSWGNNWGNKGFRWVRYKDFAEFVDFAFEMRVKKVIKEEKKDEPKPLPKPEPKPVVVDELCQLSAEMYVQLSTGEILSPLLSWDNLPVYKIKKKLMSGTRYNVYVSNKMPAYAYIIGSDLDRNVSKLFPPEGENISPVVDAADDFALPSEDMFYEMDENEGKDYLLVLFSAKELTNKEIQEISSDLRTGRGSFPNIAIKALKKQNLEINASSFSRDRISFYATTRGGVVPLIIELTHK